MKGVLIEGLIINPIIGWRKLDFHLCFFFFFDFKLVSKKIASKKFIDDVNIIKYYLPTHEWMTLKFLLDRVLKQLWSQQWLLKS